MESATRRACRRARDCTWSSAASARRKRRNRSGLSRVSLACVMAVIEEDRVEFSGTLRWIGELFRQDRIDFGAQATKHRASHRRCGERRDAEFALEFWVRPPVQGVPCEQAPCVRATLARVLLADAVTRGLQDAVAPRDFKRTPRCRLDLRRGLRDFRGAARATLFRNALMRVEQKPIHKPTPQRNTRMSSEPPREVVATLREARGEEAVYEIFRGRDPAKARLTCILKKWLVRAFHDVPRRAGVIALRDRFLDVRAVGRWEIVEKRHGGKIETYGASMPS